MADPIIDVQFSPGTVISSPWLNGVNDFVNNQTQSVSAQRVAATVAAARTANRNLVSSIQVMGYYTAGDKPAVVYYLDASDLSTPDNGGSVLVSFNGGRYKLPTPFSVADFGALPSRTAAENKAAIQACVNATPTGGMFVVPSLATQGSPIVSDATGGIANTVTIDRNMTIRMDGWIKSNSGVQQVNPQYPLKIDSATVSIVGTGGFIGNGSIDDTNTGDETVFPGLIYVTNTARFQAVGITIDTPPKVGILVLGSTNARIAHCNFIGGPTVYTTGNTAYFGIRFNAGSHNTVENCSFSASPSGGKFIQCIFSVSSHYITVIGCTANAVYEKLTYLYGNGARVIGNVVNDTTITDSFRFNQGSYNILANNVTNNTNGGTQIFDGTFNTVIGNTFLNCRQIGINVVRSDPLYTGGFSGTHIIGNRVSGAGGTLTDGIRILTEGADSTDIVIENNIISNFAQSAGEGLIRVTAALGFNVNNARISNNSGDTGVAGVVLSRVVRSQVGNNTFNALTSRGITLSACDNIMVNNNRLTNPGGYGIALLTCSNTSILDNQVRGASNNGIEGLNAISNNGNFGRGNQYTDTPLAGIASLLAAVTTTITHGGVAPNAYITCQSHNNAAGVAIVTKGQVVTAVSGNNFTITNPNGVAAAGNEQYYFQVEQ